MKYKTINMQQQFLHPEFPKEFKELCEALLGSYTDKNGEVRKYKAKYGASTTHMGKLLPRLKAGRNGGCPVLVFGITRKLIVDENE